MKIEYMKPFVESACFALQQASGGPATAGPLNLTGGTFSGASVNVAARVSGSLRGDAVCSMSGSAARQLAALMTGTDIRGFGPLMRRGLISLTTLWRQQAQLLLADMGLDCEIDGMLVFQGLNVELAMPLPALTVPIETQAGLVEISVAVRNGR